MENKIKSVQSVFNVNQEIAIAITILMSKTALHDPAEKIMQEIDNLITDSNGLEALTVEGEYVDNYYYNIVATYINRGDPYRTTILHDSKTGEFLLMSWGDFLEKKYAA